MKVLQAYVHQSSISRELASVTTTNHAASVSCERIASAMVITLFAVRFRIAFCAMFFVFILVQATESRRTNASPSFRPHTLATLLSLIQSVMHSDHTTAALNLAFPIEQLDPAQTILIRWGETVPFCWTIWDDQRIAQVESITHLVRLFCSWGQVKRGDGM